MTSVEVTDYSANYADPLVRMWRASFEHGVGITDPHALEEQLAYFRDEVLPHHRVQLAWQGTTLVGFVASNSQSVAQLHVKVGLHRQGIGSHLLRLAKSASNGSLWLFTFQQNTVARLFYEHHGFRAVKFGFEPTWQLADVKYEWHAGENAA